MWRIRLGVIGLASALALGVASAQTQPTAGIVIPPAPTSELPKLGVEAEASWVGPDERIWYFRRALTAATLAEIKQEIAEQFGKEKPTLTHSKVALFEPQGRIWFTAEAQGEEQQPGQSLAVLLGFDGRSWVERRMDLLVADRPNWPVGGVANNVFVNGRAFFTAGNEIHEFDGSGWRVHIVMVVELLSRSQVCVALMPEPDGKGLVAYARHHQQIRILRWEGNGFAEMILPPVRFAGQSVAAGTKGVWIATEGSLVLLPYDGTAPIIQLPPVLRLGKYTAKRVVQMHSDYTGRTFFLLGQMSKGDDEGTDAILMEDRDGQFLPLRHPAASARCNAQFHVDPEPAVPVAGTDGELVWLPGNESTVGPLLLDTRRGRVLHECPDIEATRLLGATRGGLLLTGGVPYSTQAKPLPKRAVERLQEQSGESVITNSGRLVANVADCLSILEQGRWQPLLAERGLQMRYSRGAEDALLLHLPDREHPGIARVALAVGGTSVEANSLAELLQQQQPLIAKYFSNRALAWEGTNGPWPAVCVNAAGDVFLAESPEYRLRLLHDGRWIDPGDHLRKLGMPAAGIRYASPVGDGSAVYLTTWGMGLRNPTAAWVRSKDGQFVFEAAPPTVEMQGNLYSIGGPRDAQGGLWMMRNAVFIDGALSNPRLLRMTETGTQEFPDVPVGNACLADAHNCIAMIITAPNAAGIFVIRDGKMTTLPIQIPRLERLWRKALEVRPGLIWIATRLGISELAEEEAGSGRYVLRETFRPALDLWAPESMGLLSDGRVGIRGAEDRVANDWRMYALPAPEAQPAPHP